MDLKLVFRYRKGITVGECADPVGPSVFSLQRCISQSVTFTTCLSHLCERLLAPVTNLWLYGDWPSNYERSLSTSKPTVVKEGGCLDISKSGYILDGDEFV